MAVKPGKTGLQPRNKIRGRRVLDGAAKATRITVCSARWAATKNMPIQPRAQMAAAAGRMVAIGRASMIERPRAHLPMPPPCLLSIWAACATRRHQRAKRDTHSAFLEPL